MTHEMTSLKTSPHVIHKVLKEMTRAPCRTMSVPKHIEIWSTYALTVKFGVVRQPSTKRGLLIACKKLTGVCYVTWHDTLSARLMEFGSTNRVLRSCRITESLPRFHACICRN